MPGATGSAKVSVEGLLRDIRDDGRRFGRFGQGAFSVPAAADYLDVSAATVRRWLDDGRLKSVPNTGRRTLIARVECDRFAAGESRRDLRVVS